ncbi:MAG: family 20 glycosylhydrolase [Verrucomicrobiota bacterium]|nr:family 20 glycosylhydrolase [Verrucomicrobiota bacterium]
MKSWILGMGLVVLATSVCAAAANTVPVIPRPQQIERSAGDFHLTRGTKIFASPGSLLTARQLAARLRPATGYPLPIKTRFASTAPVPDGILLTTKNASPRLGPEGYELLVSSNSVVLRAPTQAGLFYGAQTLWQLLPPAIFATNLVTGTDWRVPCVQIEDCPRFKWRGLMLDVSRHFYTKAEVEKILDVMALYKLNTFHWHLTDDQGWRIGIKKYPKLTQVGAWRSGIGWGLNPQSSTAYGHDGRYGGYYTRQDIREVVAYAAARHITIVPEIEMPGHSGAALEAYPQFGCTNVPAGLPHDVYDPANPATFTFLENVLGEVFRLFPGKYIHLGGDEVPTGVWAKDPGCQALMKREGLTNEAELQSWFTRRIEQFIHARGRTLIGWSEIARGGLATNAVVMDWIGGGKGAATAGHDAVMTPEAFCYVNFYQSTNRLSEPRAQGGYLSLRKVYSFEPIPEGLPPQDDSNILGAQANLWTEWIPSLPHVEYMLFPRLCALAEVDWSSKNARDWPDFRRRIRANERRLDDLGVNYRRQSSVNLTTPYLHARISLNYPEFEGLSVDSLGQERFPLVMTGAPSEPWRPVRATRHGNRVEYRGRGVAPSAPPRWTIEARTNEIWLVSHWSAADPPEPLEFEADNSICHVTLLGLMGTNGANRLPVGVTQWNSAHPDTNGSIQLPVIMHFPDQGTFRITAEPADVKSLGYVAATYQTKVIQITFPAATREDPVVEYRWKVVSIHPKIPGIAEDERFAGFRRDWLNIFQLSPHWGMLANHVSSDTCAFCYYEYADIAEHTPPLAEGLTALDMVRQTLDRIIAGANAYGMPGHGAFPDYAADTLPSLLIAAEDYVQGSKDDHWLAANYGHLRSWTDKMLSTDRDGSGLIEYTLSGDSGSWPEHIKYRPANWWDCIGFGHQDAYANALAYRALRGMEQLAQHANRPDDQRRYREAADKLKAVYFNTFYDPATGVLAGWRSADGQLHDYYFPWVNGIAIHYGLAPHDKANAIMDRLLAKMKEVGCTNFALGLPGNLVPVARKDYVDHNHRFGGGTNADGSDGFQIYENGGATACFSYFTLAALYDLGRIQDGDRILFPLLASFARGNFQGRGGDGMTKDWKAWDGTCWGYEGFLADNYYAMLAVLDREAALKRAPPAASSP